MLTRRRFLATAACTVAAARLHAQGQSRVRVAISIPKGATGPHMPIDFVGLSYEVQQLADPRFFSAANSGLIRRCVFRYVAWCGQSALTPPITLPVSPMR